MKFLLNKYLLPLSLIISLIGSSNLSAGSNDLVIGHSSLPAGAWPRPVVQRPSFWE